MDLAICFNGVCADNSVDLHPVCYNNCTPVNFMTVLDITAGNIFLLCLWIWGEFYIQKFGHALKKELDGGRAWQKRMNEREGFDLDERIVCRVVGWGVLLCCERCLFLTRFTLQAETRHSWQWNDELRGWLERKAAAKKR